MDRAQRRQLAQVDRDSRRIVALVESGQAADAVIVATRARDVYESLLGKNDPAYAYALDYVARALGARGEHTTARALLEQALALRKSAFGENHPTYAGNLNDLGQVLVVLGEYESAGQSFQKAAAIVRATLGERNARYSTALHNLGFVHSARGDYATARPLFEKSLAILRSTTGDTNPSYANGLNSLAHLLRETHDYAAARPLYEQALALERMFPGGESRPDYAATMGELAYLLRRQGATAAALSMYQQVLDLRKQTVGEHHPAYVGSLSNLAGFLQELNQHDRALPLCEQAVKLSKEIWGEHHPEYARALNLLGRARRDRGDLAGAQALLEEELAITRAALGAGHPYCLVALCNLGMLLSERSDYPRAATLLGEAVEIAEQNLDHSATAQSERQQLATAQGFRFALDDYLSVAPLAAVDVSTMYKHILVKKGAVFARQRHVGLMRRIAQDRPGSPAARLFATWEQATVELAALAGTGSLRQHGDEWKSRVAALSEKREAAESALARLDASFRVARDEARRRPEAVQAALPKDAALIDFVEYNHSSVSAGKWAQAEPRVLAFVVRPGRPIVSVALGPRDAIANAIEGWRSELIRRDGGSDQPAQEVHRLVWAPLAPHLDGAKTVLVSPDGASGRAPWAALPGKKVGTYLIEELTIAVIPAAQMLKADPKPQTPGDTAPTLLAVGDVDYGSPAGPADPGGLSRSAIKPNARGRELTFGRLPATATEIATVCRDFQASFPMGRVHTLTGPAASEHALRQEAPKCRYLHLATHGFFNPTSHQFDFSPQTPGRLDRKIDPFGGQTLVDFHPGLLCGIALAGANEEGASAGRDDGVLTALEVAVLDLSRCELAVLSACETGLGKASAGEGLLGLQRAFQTAGTQSVVATLWSVDDEATLALMSDFYANIWRRGQPPGQALRDAQLSMLRGEVAIGGRSRGGLSREADGSKSDRLAPYYWAAFVLSTDRP
jgi:CHAT domain-containing protein/Tfp pilus assembly protein PilF